MSRIKSATGYEGSPLRDVGVGSSILTRWLRNVAGDLAAVYDRLTGENGETDTIDHRGDGTGRGAPITVPLVNQSIGGRRLFTTAALVTSRSERAGPCHIVAALVRVPPGPPTRKWRLELDLSSAYDPASLGVRSWTVGGTRTIHEHTVEPNDLTGGLRITSEIDFGAAKVAADRWVAVQAVLRQDGEEVHKLDGWRLSPVVSARDNPDWTTTGPVGLGDAFAVGNQIAEDGFDTEQIADDRGLDANVLTTAAKWLGALTEYVIGGPLPGNETRTVGDEWNNNQADFANEPTPFLPIFTECLGVTFADGTPVCDTFTATPDDEPKEWAAPHPLASSSTVTIAQKIAYLPDYDDTASPTTLKCLVYVESDHAAPTDWEVYVETGAGAATPVALAAGGYANGFYARVVDIPFDAGADNFVELKCNVPAGAVPNGECSFVSWCLYFEDA